MNFSGKPVGIYDAETLLLIKTFKTITDAEAFVGIRNTLSRFIKHGNPTVIRKGEKAGLKVFARAAYTAHPNFPEVDFPHKMVIDDKSKLNMIHSGKRVNIVNLDGKVLDFYPSMASAARTLKITPVSLSDRIRDGRVIRSTKYEKSSYDENQQYGSVGPYGEPVIVKLIDDREKETTHRICPHHIKPDIFSKNPQFDKWKYRKWEIEENSKVFNTPKIGLYDTKTLMLKKICKSVAEASEILGRPPSVVSSCARSGKPINWMLKDLPTFLIRRAYTADPNFPKIDFPDKMILDIKTKEYMEHKHKRRKRRTRILSMGGKVLHTAESVLKASEILKVSHHTCNTCLRSGKVVKSTNYKKLETDNYGGSIGPFGEPVTLEYADKKAD